MTIKEMHDSLREQLGVGQSLMLTPEEIDRQINKAVSDLFLQEYKHFEATQEITDTLGFFKKKVEQDVDTNGKADYPDDYYFVTGMEAITSDNGDRPLDLTPDSEWPHKVVSFGFAPTTEYPIARYMGDNDLEVRPIYGAGPPIVPGVQKVRFMYLKSPAKAKYGYNISTDGSSYSYSAGDSTQLDFPEINHPEIERKALAYLAVNVQNPMAAQIEQLKKVTNQKT